MLFTWIWGWASSRMIRIGVVAAIAATVFAWDHNRANRHRKEAVQKVIIKSNEVARARSSKARKIRDNIKPDAAWKRLQSEYGSAGAARN